MNFRHRFISFFSINGLLLCFARDMRGQEQVEQPEQPGRTRSYLMGPKDLLAINVLEAPELNITARVSEAGNITVPLLGIIKVNGLTGAEVEQKIAALLKKSYIKDPHVTVFIKEYKSRRVSIIGAVSTPGSYEIIGKQTLLEILGNAGWVTKNATGQITINRHPPGEKNQTLAIHLEEITGKGNTTQNPVINPGDVIIAHAYKLCDIYVFGQVNRAGMIEVKQDAQMTLLRLIVKAGGFSQRARKSSVIVRRKVNGKEIKIKVNVKKIIKGKKPDFPLQPGDIIFVKESLL
ncbi:MAG: hypothetical protein GY940_24675 [bacterium]|nr:hypothetical protein [bacterium]